MLACPDCGNALRFQELTNGQHVCECVTDECRAVFATVAATVDGAADKFAQKCEQYGYTVALEEKLTAALAANEGCGL